MTWGALGVWQQLAEGNQSVGHARCRRELSQLPRPQGSGAGSSGSERQDGLLGLGKPEQADCSSVWDSSQQGQLLLVNTDALKSCQVFGQREPNKKNRASILNDFCS